MTNDTIMLIVAIFLVLIIFILTIVQNFRRKPTIIGRPAIILLMMGLLFLTLLVFRGQELEATDWAQTLLMIGLVLVTALYASSAEKQADASIKMAEEMRNARSPSITIQGGTADRNNRTISANLENEGFGSALNLKCYLTHPKFVFNQKNETYTTFKVGQKYPLSLPSENFDFNVWNGLAINCDYGSALGGRFRSILVFKTEQERTLEITERK